MSGTVTDMSQLPGLPPGAPLAVTDLVFIGRPTAISGLSAPFAIPVGLLATQLAALALNSVQIAGIGSDQGSAAEMTRGACNIIVTGAAGTGLRIPAGVGTTTAFNATGLDQVIYPPRVPNQAGTGYVSTSVNGQAPGVGLPLPAGAKVECRTVDGVNFYVG